MLFSNQSKNRENMLLCTLPESLPSKFTVLVFTNIIFSSLVKVFGFISAIVFFLDALVYLFRYILEDTETDDTGTDSDSGTC